MNGYLTIPKPSPPGKPCTVFASSPPAIVLDRSLAVKYRSKPVFFTIILLKQKGIPLRGMPGTTRCGLPEAACRLRDERLVGWTRRGSQILFRFLQGPLPMSHAVYHRHYALLACHCFISSAEGPYIPGNSTLFNRR